MYIYIIHLKSITPTRVYVHENIMKIGSEEISDISLEDIPAKC